MTKHIFVKASEWWAKISQTISTKYCKWNWRF